MTTVSISQQIRWLHHHLYIQAVQCRRGAIDPQHSLLLTGSPRSGTTWIGSVIASAPDTAMCTEPFDLCYPAARQAGLTWRTYRDADESWPEGEHFFAALLAAQAWRPRQMPGNRIWQAFQIKRQLIKAVRINRLLPWLDRQFPDTSKILLMRHPCAVVASQLNYPPITKLPSEDEECIATLRPDLLKWAQNLCRNESLRALRWALDLWVPLQHDMNSVQTICYETLVRDGFEKLQTTLEACHWPCHANMPRMINRNSRERRPNSPDFTRDSLNDKLYHWKRKLNRNQIDMIAEVIERTGMSTCTPYEWPCK